MLRPFALFRPTALPEVIDLLEAHGDDVALYAGGTELLLLMKEGIVRPRGLVDVKRVARLGEIAASGDGLIIGATVCHRDLERSPGAQAGWPLVAGVARHVANVRVRNVGTVGGNLAFADPHSDLATLFLALDGVVTLEGRAGARALALSEFVRGAYETARRPGEVMTSVRLPPWPAGRSAAYLKYGVYERPTLGMAVALTAGAGGGVTGARVAVGCVGPRPRRLVEVEGQIIGRTLDEIEAGAGDLEVAAVREVETMDDRHGSAEYKRAMTGVFLRRALGVVLARARGEEIGVRYARTIVV